MGCEKVGKENCREEQRLEHSLNWCRIARIHVPGLLGCEVVQVKKEEAISLTFRNQIYPHADLGVLVDYCWKNELGDMAKKRKHKMGGGKTSSDWPAPQGVFSTSNKPDLPGRQRGLVGSENVEEAVRRCSA